MDDRIILKEEEIEKHVEYTPAVNASLLALNLADAPKRKSSVYNKPNLEKKASINERNFVIENKAARKVSLKTALSIPKNGSKKLVFEEKFKSNSTYVSGKPAPPIEKGDSFEQITGVTNEKEETPEHCAPRTMAVNKHKFEGHSMSHNIKQIVITSETHFHHASFDQRSTGAPLNPEGKKAYPEPNDGTIKKSGFIKNDLGVFYLPDNTNPNTKKVEWRNKDALDDLPDFVPDDERLREILPGEKEIDRLILCIYSDKIICTKKALTGFLQLTNYKLAFIPPKKEIESHAEYFGLRGDYFFHPYSNIEKIERGKKKLPPGQGKFKIITKNYRKFKLLIKSSSTFNVTSQFESTFESLQMMIRRERVESFFAFNFFDGPHNFEPSEVQRGWNVFKSEGLMKEFTRQGISQHIQPFPYDAKEDMGDSLGPRSKYLWQVVDNRNYCLSSTYPSFFVVPSKLLKDEIEKCANFRTKNRLPILTFAYKFRKNDSEKLVTLWRSSQPKSGGMSGIKDNRCIEDEKMLRLIGNPESNESYTNVNKEINCHVFDCRPYSYAYGNRINGGGFENTSFYKNCNVSFLSIDNIHAVREAYKKIMFSALHDDSVKWFQTVDSSKWLELISIILQGAKRVVNTLKDDLQSVLIHCSDGWDRTAQIVSLAQILIDPYYRTIQGFQVLVQKEWVTAGHQFNLRNGLGPRSNPADQKSPIFIQFLDCVHQIVAQYPLSFEFNIKFLCKIAYHLYSSRFGNFFCNCEKEMTEKKVMEKTVSLWTWLNSKREIYVNPLFIFHPSMSDIISPETSVKFLRIWKEHFFYYHPNSECPYTNENCLELEADFTEEYPPILYREKLKELDEKKQEVQALQEQLAAKDAETKRLRDLLHKYKIKERYDEDILHEMDSIPNELQD